MFEKIWRYKKIRRSNDHDRTHTPSIRTLDHHLQQRLLHLFWFNTQMLRRKSNLIPNVQLSRHQILSTFWFVFTRGYLSHCMWCMSTGEFLFFSFNLIFQQFHTKTISPKSKISAFESKNHVFHIRFHTET